MLLPIYLRKVHHNLGFDVMAYREPEAVKPVAHWQWYAERRPDRRFKTVTLNCYRWRIVWLSDA